MAAGYWFPHCQHGLYQHPRVDVQDPLESNTVFADGMLFKVTTCRLCGQTLDEPHHPTVLTTDGDRVHITCADRAAVIADHRRVVRAMISAMVLTDLFMVAMFSDSSGLVLGLLVGLLIAARLDQSSLVVPAHGEDTSLVSTAPTSIGSEFSDGWKVAIIHPVEK